MSEPLILSANTVCNPSILESAAGLKMGPTLDSLPVLTDSGFHPVRSCQMPAPSKDENSSQNQVPRVPRKFVMFDNSLHHGARFFVFPDISESSLRTTECAMPKAVCNPPAAGEVSQDAVQSFVTKQLVGSPKETDKSISQAIALLQQMRHSRLYDIFGDVLGHPVVNAREERENCSSKASRVSDVASEGCFQEDSGDIDALLSLDGNYSDDEDGDLDEDEDEDEVTSCLHPLTEDFSPDVNQVQNAIPSKRKWHYGVDGIEEQISVGLVPENGVLHQPLKAIKKQKMEMVEDSPSSPRRKADAATVLDGVIEYVKLLQRKVSDLEARKHANS